MDWSPKPRMKENSLTPILLLLNQKCEGCYPEILTSTNSSIEFEHIKVQETFAHGLDTSVM